MQGKGQSRVSQNDSKLTVSNMNAVGHLPQQPMAPLPSHNTLPQDLSNPNIPIATNNLPVAPPIPQNPHYPSQILGSTPLSQIGITPLNQLDPFANGQLSPSGSSDELDDSELDGSSLDEHGRRIKRSVLPKHATSVMRAWLFQHLVVSIRLQFVTFSVFH